MPGRIRVPGSYRTGSSRARGDRTKDRDRPERPSPGWPGTRRPGARAPPSTPSCHEPTSRRTHRNRGNPRNVPELPGQELGDLDRVEGGALAEVVAGGDEQQRVVAAVH